MSNGGYSCSGTVNGTFAGLRTYLDYKNVVDASGSINKWCVYAYNPCSLKLKIFRGNIFVDPGASLVWESDITSFVSGRNVVYVSAVSVQASDWIGFYRTDAGNSVAYMDIAGETVGFISGDVSTYRNPPSGATGDIAALVKASYDTSYDTYVDLNKADDTGDGFTWTTAKKNMYAGYSVLSTGGTMHVATGDYSGQSGITYTKSWFLMPEDPNSTGSKNVKIPPSV